MSTSRHIDKICVAAMLLALVLTVCFSFGGVFGIAAAERIVRYESTIFDDSYVHSIDIVMNDWDSFIEDCESEEYSACTVVIDGKKYGNIAIRAKGNTSLSNVKSMDSERYSFKLEFDHYEAGKSCDGLDKLCLNNLIQDNTMMKDYLVYRMMDDFGADAPLCSFAYITVNGNDWGLYLAVEGVEDSFLSRNYGSDAGELYKPDSMSFGGGRGNGKDFKMDDFDFDGDMPENNFEDRRQMPGGFGDFGGRDEIPQDLNFPGGQHDEAQGPGGRNDKAQGPGGRGSDDVKLKYIDDDPDSYANIFDNAKTDVTQADKERLVSALKSLSEYSALENVLDTDEVLRYFAVHNFVCNGDSYTGSMIHNYYLHEKNGRLGMIPWDYNLAFGTFQGGSASSSVNASIDSPVTGGDADDRPMVGWIFSDAEYTARYHELLEEFIERWFANGELSEMIGNTAEMLRPYVEKDPAKFCTTEDFEKGVSALIEFTELRAEAVSRQLAGDFTAVDTGSLDISSMGTMGRGMGEGRGGEARPGGFEKNRQPYNRKW